MADVINRGNAPGDKSADNAYVGAGKINQKFAALDAGGSFARLNISTASLTASFRDDGSGNLGWYVGAAGAADGAQVKAAAVDKTTGAVTFPVKVTLGNASGVSGNFADWRLLTANGRGWRVGTASTGTTHDYFYIQGTTDGFASSFVNGIAIHTSGAVMLGSTAAADSGVALDVRNGIVQSRAASGSASFYATAVAGQAKRMVFRDGGGSFRWVIQSNASAESGSNAGSNLEFNRYDDAGTLISAGLSIARNNGAVTPGTDNAQSLGGASNRWSVVYAGTGTINTSDAREKTEVRALDAAEIAAARDLAGEIGVYQWLASIEEKGEDARLHVGLTVQRAIAIMEGHGLDPWRYGFICRDAITRRVKTIERVTEQALDDVTEFYFDIEIRGGAPVLAEKRRTVQRPRVEMVAVVDEAGEPIMTQHENEQGEIVTAPMLHPVPVMVTVEREVEIDEPAGERLGFRYDQLALFILRGLSSRLEVLEG